MKHLTRRTVTTGALAAVTAIPAVGLSSGLKATMPAKHGEDRLVEIIRRYKSGVEALNATCKVRDIEDEKLDAWVDENNELLASAVGVPALTAADALAALDLVVDEEEIGDHSVFGEQMRALIYAVRGYIVSTAGART
jgi:hypothetical protein